MEPSLETKALVSAGKAPQEESTVLPVYLVQSLTSPEVTSPVIPTDSQCALLVIAPLPLQADGDKNSQTTIEVEKKSTDLNASVVPPENGPSPCPPGGQSPSELSVHPQGFIPASSSDKSASEVCLPKSSRKRPAKGSPLVCTYEGCQRKFSWATHLRYHLLSHSQVRSYKCQVPGCGMSFLTPQRLTVHQRTHTGERPFACPEPGCHKSFTTNGNLANHLRVHSGERPFVCSQCGRGFAEKSSLKKHQVKHSGKKPFVCEICKQEFTQSSSRAVHMKRNHPEALAQQGQKAQPGARACERLNQDFPKASSLESQGLESAEKESHVLSDSSNNQLVFEILVRDGMIMYQQTQPQASTAEAEEEQSLGSFHEIEETSQADYLKLDQCMLGTEAEDAITQSVPGSPSSSVEDSVIVLSQPSAIASQIYHTTESETDILCSSAQYTDQRPREQSVYDEADLLTSQLENP